ncbi:MAG: CapA family protein [Rhodospirillales bacterium]
MKLAAVGQSLIKRDIGDNDASAFRRVVDIVKSADIAFTNLEGTIRGTHGGWPAKSSLVGAAPPAVLDALRKIGFGVLSLSNNHAFDLGPNGILSTLEEVSARGFVSAGIGRNKTEAALPGIGETAAGKIALIAMDAGPWPDYWYAKDADAKAGERPGINGLAIESEITVTASELDILRTIDGDLGHRHLMPKYRKRSGASAAAETDVLPFYGLKFRLGEKHEKRGIPKQSDVERHLSAIAKAAEKADFVIVYVHHHHWEAELEKTPQWIQEFAKQCIDAGGHIFVSHGTPFLQGIEIYRGQPIFYGLGNFIFHSGDPTGWHNDDAWKSVVATCDFDDRNRLRRIMLDPIIIGGPQALADKNFQNRETPHAVNGKDARLILEKLSDISAVFKTGITIEESRGIIDLPL